ncbi:PAP2-domain-containing protein [Diplogelasinospora grovesii]|uniref:PAP2-domain-containing protein n=1 Tax=Diplogelasinospora grovesii TaxID=303347 RepID=A0AAN6N9W5_9PEZI|nr:PAP2-domain-containing protein [Diplogelasinospora grovesii]
MPDETISPLIPRSTNPYSRILTPTHISDPSSHSDHPIMDDSRGRRKGRGANLLLTASYVFDWAILVIAAVVGYVLGNITPNKRPFSLEDRDISFPFTVHETVPTWLLVMCSTVAPIVIVAIISLIFVPGSTVPRGTPKSLVWKRKLWELHAGWLGLALSLVAAWFITNGMKNLFGKPRPDLISRCQPDLANLSKYIVGGIANSSSNGQLVSGDICKNPDKYILDDGFRSYPSGHSSSSAAGLIYLSLFIASKFAITLPFLAPSGYADASAFTAFPSRIRPRGVRGGGSSESYELPTRNTTTVGNEHLSAPLDPALQKRVAQHTQTVAAVRRQAAAPPLYLLVICVLPFFAAIFIASSRWFDFRHHGFDILFGFFIGTITAFFSFRYYHLPISQGAGWAWGPRSHDKAFWAGVGSFSYATEHVRGQYHRVDEEEGLADGYGRGTGLQTDDGAAAAAAVGRKPMQEEEDTAYAGAGRS